MFRGSGLRRAARLGRWVLVVLTAWASALAANEIVFPDPVVEGGKASARAVSSRLNSLAKPPSPKVILERNLFGAQPLVAADTGNDARGFAEGLTLLGTASSEGRAFAVFEDKGGVQEIFLVGERVFEGAKLTEIESDAATLSSRGRKRRYEILLDGPDDAPAPKGGAKRGSAAPPNGIRATKPGNYRVDRREVDFAIENLNYVITQARAVPVLRDGKATGYKLFNIRPGSLFERLGLRNGDVVQRVNGNELDNPGKAIGLLDEIQSMEEIRMDFLRGGKPQTFEYTIR